MGVGRGTAEQWIKEEAGAALDAAVLPRLPGQRKKNTASASQRRRG